MTTVYGFHLGRETELSIAELEAVLGRKVEAHGEVALIEFKEAMDAQGLLDELGGCIKVSRVLRKVGTDPSEAVASALLTIFPEGKIHFGLNVYPSHDAFLNKTLKKVKPIIKEYGRNGRFLNQKTNLTSAIIKKGGLLKSGSDLNLIETSQGTWLTQTVAVQNFEAYSRRDYEKPARLAKAGMLPPKLAQIIINLTQLTTGPTDLSGKTLYDPFCGSGTVLGEALIKGIKVVGSDLDPVAIKAAQQNLEWLKKTDLTPDPQADIRLFESDATLLTRNDLPHPPDMIVSETYLGPPIAKSLPEEQITALQKDLLQLYRKTFEALHPLLHPGTPIVMAFPAHDTRKGLRRLPHLVEEILPIGYKLNRSLLYHRKQQWVGREILILETH